MLMLNLYSAHLKYLECKFLSKSDEVIILGPIFPIIDYNSKITISNLYSASSNWPVCKFSSKSDEILILGSKL